MPRCTPSRILHAMPETMLLGNLFHTGKFRNPHSNRLRDWHRGLKGTTGRGHHSEAILEISRTTPHGSKSTDKMSHATARIHLDIGTLRRNRSFPMIPCIRCNNNYCPVGGSCTLSRYTNSMCSNWGGHYGVLLT